MSKVLPALPLPRPDWREGNRIELLRNGETFFPALFEAIDAARRSVHLETYIFNLDATGLRLLEHLQRARRRGVKVRVVIDGFGSQLQAVAIAERLAQMGAQCRVYRPEPRSLRETRFSLRRLRRMHRKMALVDEAVAFVGGINILDDFEQVPDDGRGPMPRFDFAVRLQGPIVRDVSRTMWLLWLRMRWRRRDDWAAFYRRVVGLGQRRRQRLPAARVYQPGQRAILLLRDNLRNRHVIEQTYLRAMAVARREIILANAYFFPGRRLRRALKDAAARGLRVRLLLQGRMEYPVQYWAGRYLYGRLLAAGIEIHEYMPSYLHAKVAVIDDCAMVGSANLDPFSLLLAREANVYVADAGFAAELRETLDRSIREDAVQVTSDALRRRGWRGRLCDALAYLLLRLGVALTGKASEY